MEWRPEDREAREKIDELVRLGRETVRLLKEILAALQPKPATSIAFLFGKTRGENMPLILPLGDQDNVYLFGTAPFLGALLAAGQTISLVSADPATASFVADASPVAVRAADASAQVPAGTPTVLSGVVTAAQSPAQPNVPITFTATVLNADGSTAETLTDTVTVQPGAATAIGDLFGVAVPVTSTVAPQAKKG